MNLRLEVLGLAYKLGEVSCFLEPVELVLEALLLLLCPSDVVDVLVNLVDALDEAVASLEPVLVCENLPRLDFPQRVVLVVGRLSVSRVRRL